jgi:hypothetical protein
MDDFSAAVSRRRILAAAAIAAATECACAVLLSTPAVAQQKIAKGAAGYRDHPNGPAHCELCAYYLAPVACRLVRGEVSPNGWCRLFQAKAG